MREIVFLTIRARAKRDVKRKCKDRNREKMKNKRFKVGE
jgi:hypothetical protein